MHQLQDQGQCPASSSVPEQESDDSVAGQAISPPIAYGAAVGALMGPVTSGMCNWLLAQADLLWQWLGAGAALGALGGALIASKINRKRYADVGTIICVVYGLLPAVVILISGVGLVQGKFHAYLLLAAVSVGPTVGLLVGAFLDRTRERLASNRRGTMAERDDHLEGE